MEQLAFIRKLFDFGDVKVHLASVYGIIGSLVCTLPTLISQFSNGFIGISAGLFVLLFIVMIIDYTTGLAACKREGGVFISRRGLQWVFKFGSYLIFLAFSYMFRKEVIANELEWMDIPLKLIHFYILVHIFTWELQSVDENLERLGFSFRVFKLFSSISKMIRGMIKKKIDE